MKLPSFTNTLSAFGNRMLRSKILNWVYFALMILTFLAIAAMLFPAISFLVSAFNGVLSVSDEDMQSGTPSFDRAAFARLSGKLGIRTPEIPGGIVPPTPAAAVPAPVGTASTSVVASSTAPDIGTLKITLLNGTAKPGLAKIWKKRLEEAGFKEITVGNSSEKIQNGFKISYRSSLGSAVSFLKEVFAKYGASALSEGANDSGESDAVIILGQ